MYQSTFYKIGPLAGMYYSNGKKHKTIIVYGIGAPLVPDSGQLPDAPIIMNYNVDLFVPDYFGYGRSEGRFTPKNCIKTFTYLFEKLKQGAYGVNCYAKKKRFFQYRRIIFIGKSLGGTYIPLLPRYNQQIKELALFCPVVDSKLCGSIKGEETNALFLKSMKKDGYHHLYRGINSSVWKKHLENNDDLSPMDNIKYLKDARLFIAHGKLDSCVHYSKSVAYYNKLIRWYGSGHQYKIKLYPKGAHDKTTTNFAVKDFLDWILSKNFMI